MTRKTQTANADSDAQKSKPERPVLLFKKNDLLSNAKYGQNFRLENMIYDLDRYYRLYVANNIPSTQRDLRIHMFEEIYHLHEDVFSATFTKGNIRRKHLSEMKKHMSLVDMLLRHLGEHKYVKAQKIEHCSALLCEIKTIVYGWAKREELASKTK